MSASRPRRGRAILLLALGAAVLDTAMAALAFYLAYEIRRRTAVPSAPVNIPPFAAYTQMLLIHVATLLVVFFFHRLYQVRRRTVGVDEFSAIVSGVSLGAVFTTALTAFLFKNELDYPRAMVVYAWGLTVVLVTLARIGYRRLLAAARRRGVGRIRTLVVGTGEAGRLIYQRIVDDPSLGYEAVGLLEGNGSRRPRRANGLPVVGRAQDLPRLIEERQVEEVIICLPDATRQEILEIIAPCKREQVTIKVYPDIFQIMASEVSVGDLGGVPLLTLRDIALRGWKRGLKRATDVVISGILLVLMSPLLLLTAILIKLDSPGPVFFTQERVGLDAKPFPMVKFRSMIPGAERETGPVWSRPGDPRRTRLGGILRRFSVDELPQLINVLLGHMSLVGPRPERPVFVEAFERVVPNYMERHIEKAGITGWAQINGLRGDTSVLERTKYDLYYVENWSLWFDFKIILITGWRVLFDKNAY